MMKILRTASLTVLLTLGIVLASCATLPDVDVPSGKTVARDVPTVATAQGRLGKRQAADLLAKRWARATPDLKALAVLEEAATGVPLIAGNKVTLLFDGPATMKEMMAAAGAAKSSINLETYIFDQDEIGLQFAQVLMQKQKQGVTVNVMYDSVGALGVPKEFFASMRAAGINVLEANPVLPNKRVGKWEINNRDHRKVMVVDGKVGFTGGINISKTYANSSLFRSRQPAQNADGKSVGWRDTHVKIEGPAVAA